MDKNAEVKRRLDEQLRFYLGPLILDALNHEKTTEVYLNQDGRLWWKRHGEAKALLGEMDTLTATNIITSVADREGRVANISQPSVQGILPLDGSRFQGVLPPTAMQPIFLIRKKARVIYTLENYERDGIITAEQRELLEDAIEKRLNILVVGGTGSGKTTLLNALLHRIGVVDPDCRVGIIEDTLELQYDDLEDVNVLLTNDATDMDGAIRMFLRLSPDRLFVGEMRGKEAYTLLKVWNSGHKGGAATIHSDDPLSGLMQLEYYIQEVSLSPQHKMIANVVDVIVSIQKDPSHKAGRRITDMLRLTGYEDGQYQYQLYGR
ncbi:MAG: P-type conjugative transfer ATPase TrbB [Burkholderia sp.]